MIIAEMNDAMNIKFRKYSSSRSTATRGVSLIELLVVIIIIGILLSVVNASYSQFYVNIASKGFAAAILTKSREAKNLTRSLGKDVTLVLDLDNESAWLTVDGKMVGSAIAPAVESVEIKGFMDDDNAGTFRTTGQKSIVFTAHTVLNIDSTCGSFKTVMQVGPKSAAYGTTASNANDFNSIMFFMMSSTPTAYNVGCVAADAWEPWFSNPSYPWKKCVSL
ncbi:MAG: hypothetical protein COS94_02220 [Candidatus Hydrogenedentes bacterium CG07_land_8_20_14_0_80_42_17]|nr:MAG: hypothetical protein COS94_02220 [Candidatus Hydrogenedentes bacterium CG07_land_8_20_14_0_80_42_17]